jgi:hypothetical protein
MNRADGPTIRTSQASARFTPAPTAAPLTAATVRAVAHREEAVVDAVHVAGVALALFLRATHRRQAGHHSARAERGRRARDHDGADAVVGLDRLDCADDLAHELAAQGVAPLCVVEGEHRHPVAVFDVQWHSGLLLACVGCRVGCPRDGLRVVPVAVAVAVGLAHDRG